MKRIIRDGFSYFEPPEKPEPKRIEFEDELNFPLDAIIYIDKDGTWDYEEYQWMEKNDGISFSADSDEYPDLSLELADMQDVMEHLDDLLMPLLPYGPGRYKITGDVTLSFNVTNVEEIETDDPLYSTYYTDRADVEFQFDKSSIEDFEIEEI